MHEGKFVVRMGIQEIGGAAWVSPTLVLGPEALGGILSA